MLDDVAYVAPQGSAVFLLAQQPCLTASRPTTIGMMAVAAPRVIFQPASPFFSARLQCQDAAAADRLCAALTSARRHTDRRLWLGTEVALGLFQTQLQG